MAKRKKVDKGIYQLAAGYQIKVMVNGESFQAYVEGLGNLSEAQAIRSQAVADLKRGITPSYSSEGQTTGTRPTLNEAFEAQWEHKWSKQSDGYQTKVIQGYDDIKSFFEGELGQTRMDLIKTEDIDKYTNYLANVKGNSDSTINNKLAFLSPMFKLMVKRGRLADAPVIEWKSVDNSRIRYYSYQEEQTILDLVDLMDFHCTSINELLKDFIIVLFDTGMRPWMEAHQMRRGWITQDTRGNTVIRIPKEYSKTNKVRDIPLAGRVLEVIWRRCAGLERDDRLFGSLDYKWHCVRFWRDVVRPSTGWGDEEVYYCMRHTFATRLCEYGVNLKVVQELMGHTNINQTAQYAKATDEAKAGAIALLQSYREERQNADKMPMQGMQNAVQNAVQNVPAVGREPEFPHAINY